jgi:aspartyl protease family protein
MRDFFQKNILRIAIFFLMPLNTFSQSNVSYTKLTPLLNLVRNCVCCNACLFYPNEEPLIQKIKALNWDFNDTKTFDTLYEQLKDQKFDYRYNLIIAKSTSRGSINNVVNDSISHIISFYYKSLFLNLAIENNNNRIDIHTDSLRYQYTENYILSRLKNNCFPTENDFTEFAINNIKYAKILLSSYWFKLNKLERSNLYYIIADALYMTKDVENEDKENLGEVLKNLSLALNENPDNWRALSKRAYIKKTIIKNYALALTDYLHLLDIFEKENKLNITEHNKWLLKRNFNLSEHKMLYHHATFEEMLDIVDCYINLNDNKKVLIWLDKATISIKEYRKYISNPELATSYEGLIYYFKAISHFEMKQKKLACSELEKAVNFGYDIDECNKLQIEMNCIKASLVNKKLEINSIPMNKIGGVYEIPITINGVLKLNFIFDAGASDVSISSDVALTLIRTGTVKNEDFIGTETYKFADGSTAKSKVFIIKEIQVGDRKVFNIKASISNSLTAPLLLGQSVLNKFGKVIIDYKNEMIIFED